MNKPYVRSLNDNQYELLLAIYSFRFSTRSLLSEYCGVPNNTSFYSRLQILQKHGYIAAHYDKSYKLAGREAEFYLLPKGLRVLRDTERLKVSDAMLAALYKDKAVGSNFITRQIRILYIRNKLIQSHEELQIFTARDIQLLEYFPAPRPDLFLSMKTDEIVTRYFLEYIPAGMLVNKIRKRLVYLFRYYEEANWSETNTPFPTLLFVAETKLVETTVRRLVERECYHSNVEALAIYFTTTTDVARMDANAIIWRSTSRFSDLAALGSM